VQPDLFVVPFTPGQPPREWTEVRDLLLVIEVLSPCTAHVDRHRKRRIYLEEGVPTYWIVDLDARRIECRRPGAVHPTVHEQSISWQPRTDVAPLEIDLLAFFAAQP
jgi:Uma2 family endonuclease